MEINSVAKYCCCCWWRWPPFLLLTLGFLVRKHVITSSSLLLLVVICVFSSTVNYCILYDVSAYVAYHIMYEVFCMLYDVVLVPKKQLTPNVDTHKKGVQSK